MAPMSSLLTRPWVVLALLVAVGCAGSSGPPAPDVLGPFASRQDFLHRLEPHGNRVLHGAGANPQDFADYWDELERTPPLLYATHLDLMTLREDWPAYVGLAVNRFPSVVLPQLAVSMTYNGRPYEVDVALGRLDRQIEILCAGLAALQRPAFVRLGYGFNSPTTGYRPEPYRQAWVRVAESIRVRHGLRQVAMVWGAAADAPMAGAMDFYPGDSWVDWWGIDVFDPSGMVSDGTVTFLEAARERGYPVMVGEATPRGLTVETGSHAWERWFVPFFRFVHRHPNIKAFCYINWRSGEARISSDLDLLPRYVDELSRDEYLNSAASDDLRWSLQIDE